MNRTKLKPVILLVLCLSMAAFTQTALADLSWTYTGSLLTVVSFTDENGFFSYTFTRGPDPFLWGMDLSGGIVIRSYGIQAVFDPVGWESTVDNSGNITWEYVDEGTWFIEDVPVTFSLQSSISQSTMYDSTDPSYPRGVVMGGTYDMNYEYEAVGFERFHHFGPVPEPSTAILLLVAASIQGLKQLRKRKA